MQTRIMAVLLGTMLSTAAFAQDEMGTMDEGGAMDEAGAMEGAGDGTKMAVGADFALVIPVGDFGDIAGIGIGALPKFGYTVTDEIMATARIGYIHHLAKDIGGTDFTVSQIPIMFGGKYLAGDLYGAAEIGFVNLKIKTEVPLFGEVSDSETNLAFGFGGGYMMGPVDLRLGLNMIDLGNAGESMELMLNVGYDFARF